MPHNDRPGEVALVAALLLAIGVYAAFDFAEALFAGRITVGLELLALPAGLGLLAGHRFWHGAALLLVKASVLAALFVGAVLAFSDVPLRVDVLGWTAGSLPAFGLTALRAATVSALVLTAGVFLWADYALTRPHVRAHFAR